MTAVIDKLKFLLGDEIVSDNHWREFLTRSAATAKKLSSRGHLLRANSKVLLDIIKLIPVAFFVKDNKSRFFLMNRACEEQWGMSPTCAARMRATFSHPIRWSNFWPRIAPFFESKKPVELKRHSGVPLSKAIGLAERSSGPCMTRTAIRNISCV